MQPYKKRLLNFLAKFVILVVLGLLYAWFCNYFGFGIPCLFYTMTGFKCPGCGITTMCICLLHWNFVGAFQANPAIFLLLPLGIYFFLVLSYRYVRYNTMRLKKWENIVVSICCVILLVFGVLRNIYHWY